jgi:twitching motility protein PilT
MRVLIVHDDAGFNDRVLASMSASFPEVECRFVGTAPDALGAAKEQCPDVIIADGGLPGVDGYMLTRQIKDDPDLAQVPVLLVAREHTRESAVRAQQAGAAAQVPLTVDPTTLMERAASLVSRNGNGSGRAPASAAAGRASSDAAVVDPPAVQADAPVISVETDDGLPSIDDMLRYTIEQGASDLHLTVGSPPSIRLNGHIVPIEDTRTLTREDTQRVLEGMLSEAQLERFAEELELDFAYGLAGVSRFRVNVFQQRHSMGAAFRAIPVRIPTIEELGLPKVCRQLADLPRGLVLVTGPTGSGKSTTLAAMIDHINETRPVHIVTMEDPIEFMHSNKLALVNQREVGEDTHSFNAALKRVLRQDPDVILVGEMRDLETIAAALTAAETGHLVLATLHTTGGPETVDRIIDVFPPHQQQQVRMQLSTTLEGVLSQTLLRSADEHGRVLAMEIMLGVPAISNLIREGKTHQMTTIIQGGASIGMRTLDQDLKTLVQSGKVTYEEAMQKSKEPRELAQMLGRRC